MKKNLNKYFLPISIALCVIVFILVYTNLSKTVDEIARALLYEKSDKTKSQLDNFFDPVISHMNIVHKRASLNEYDSIPLQSLNLHFLPLLEDCAPISSMMLANSRGNEYMLLDLDTLVINRKSENKNKLITSTIYEWEKVEGRLKLQKKYNENKNYDCRKSLWFTNAANDHAEKIHWTEPYSFSITKDPGLTISRRWTDKQNIHHVLAFDVMLWDVSKYTTNLKITENGSAFVLTEDGRILGLPRWSKYDKDEGTIRFDVLQHAKSFKNTTVSHAYSEWDKSKDEYFSFNYDGESWRGVLVPYQLGSQKLYIGVIAPESDFLSRIHYTMWVIIGGMIIAILFIFFLIRAYRQINIVNSKLNTKNDIIEEKSKEIKDSINYAKRIQNALLPSKGLFRRYFPNSFVYYQPKDIVAGDFYWVYDIRNADNSEVKGLLIAVADCTGHGVPGAMVSVVCNNALNRSVREFKLHEPNQILDKTREILLQEFEKSEREINDGMDIALIHIEIPSKKNDKTKDISLVFSGAQNPIWIIREGSSEVEVLSGDRQPVGNFSKAKPFSKQSLNLNFGDTFYLFSDGFTDQFGGSKGKKYKTSRFKLFLLSIQDLSMEDQQKRLDIEMNSWKGDMEQIDDICVVGIRL